MLIHNPCSAKSDIKNDSLYPKEKEWADILNHEYWHIVRKRIFEKTKCGADLLNNKIVTNIIWRIERCQTHEGYCFLYPQNNENVSDIVEKNGWILKINYGNGYYK